MMQGISQSELSEDDLIATLFAPIAGPGALGLKDDVACFTPPAGCDLIVTKDALVAGVHFYPDDPPDTIARKALRVNVSDVIAKGADPLGFLLAIALPNDVSLDWLQAFAQALGQDAALYSCPLLGGDTVRTPGPLMLSITALGSVPNGRMVARTGAQIGDAIYVSGTIGDAALGLYMRTDAPAWTQKLSLGDKEILRQRYLVPQPRLALRHVLRDHAHCAMDVSDGLVGDLSKMMRASKTGARVELARTPLSDSAQAAIAFDNSLFETALTCGDDYEILCTIAPRQCASFEAGAQAVGVIVTRIGEVLAGDTTSFVEASGVARILKRGSYSHF